MADDIWTIHAALDWTRGYLERKGIENPRLSAEWLLAEACSMRRINLYVNYERPLSIDERAVLRDYVRRRGTGEPLQYITGEVGFRHIVVKVCPGVLIPRPETEVLVSEVISRLNSAQDKKLDSDEETQPERMLVADIGTGSGCIACSLAHELPNVHVIATDISPEAVALARENVAALDLQDSVEVLQGDLGEPIGPEFLGMLDAVVSNPPYVPTEVLASLPSEVSDFEPELALDGGDDGLDVFRRLLDWAKSALKPEGFLAVELHETTLDEAAALAREVGFANTAVVNDLAGKPRILIAHQLENSCADNDA